MNTSNVICSVTLGAPATPAISIKSRVSKRWRAFTQRLFAEPVIGNPLHEAWTADGEPLERMTPEQVANSNATCRIVVPLNRGQ